MRRNSYNKLLYHEANIHNGTILFGPHAQTFQAAKIDLNVLHSFLKFASM